MSGISHIEADALVGVLSSKGFSTGDLLKGWFAIGAFPSKGANPVVGGCFEIEVGEFWFAPEIVLRSSCMVCSMLEGMAFDFPKEIGEVEVKTGRSCFVRLAVTGVVGEVVFWGSCSGTSAAWETGFGVSAWLFFSRLSLVGIALARFISAWGRSLDKLGEAIDEVGIVEVTVGVSVAAGCRGCTDAGGDGTGFSGPGPRPAAIAGEGSCCNGRGSMGGEINGERSLMTLTFAFVGEAALPAEGFEGRPLGATFGFFSLASYSSFGGTFNLMLIVRIPEAS